MKIPDCKYIAGTFYSFKLDMLPFEIQEAVMSGMAKATKSDSGSDSSLDNVVRIQLRLKQFMEYIFL